MQLKLVINRSEYRDIARSWNGCTYFSQTWRFYHNNQSGAAVIIDGQRTALDNAFAYLISPNTLFQTEQECDVIQFYIHFDLTLPTETASPGAYQIPFDSTLQNLKSLACSHMSKNAPSHFTPRGHSLVASIASYACSRLPEEVFVPTQIDPRIQRILADFEAHPERPHRIDTLARSASLSRSAFIRSFKEQTGLSPYALLTNLRITLARELLSFTDQPIDTISQRTGFNDRFHFSKLFKAKTGTTPAAYRKSHPSSPSSS